MASPLSAAGQRYQQQQDGSGGMTDEVSCVRAITAALSQVARRVSGDIPDHMMSSEPSSDLIMPASIEECVEFLSVLDGLINEASNDDSVRRVVFEHDPTLLGTLMAFLHAPQTPTSDRDPTAALYIGTLRILNRIAVKVTTPFLANMVNDELSRHQSSHAIALLIAPSLPNSVRIAAAEVLFAVLLRIENQRKQLRVESIYILLEAFHHSSPSQLRAYAVACLRETANSNAAALMESDAVSVLVRCVALDASPDVRGLAAETIDVVFKSDVVYWSAFGSKRELTQAVLGRLEREDTNEVAEAVLKLLETLIVTDAALPASTEESLTDMLIHGFVERYLVAVMGRGQRVASLAARCLRLLLQYAPYFSFVGYKLCSHFPTFAKFMQVLSQLSKQPGTAAQPASSAVGGAPADNVVLMILKVEAAMALAIILAVDPRSRKIVSEQLFGSGWTEDLRAVVLQGLNGAALEYYAGIALTDVTGQLLNAPSSVVWEGTRPTRSSIQALFNEQERLWQAMQDGAEDPPAGRPTSMSSEEGAGNDRICRLTFVLLSFAVHVAMQDRTPQQQPAAAAQQQSLQQEQQQHQTGARQAYADPTSPQGRGSHGVGSSASRARLQMPNVPAAPSSTSHYTPISAASAAPTLPASAVPPAPTTARELIFSKFDAALELAATFAQYFERPGAPKRVVYETDGSFARRVNTSRESTWFAKPTPGARTWSIEQLKEGDLFYFAIPLSVLSSFSIEQVRSRATRHLVYVKKSFTITPQSAKARRWFLFDMLNHIMPGIINALTDLLSLFHTFGDENVKFPIVMFREKDAIGSGPNAASVHVGNLLKTIDEVRFYFRNADPNAASARTTASLGMAAAHTPGGADASGSQYLRDLDAKIHALSTLRFTGKEASFLPDDGLDNGEQADEDAIIDNTEPTAHLRSRELNTGRSGQRGGGGFLGIVDDDDDDY